MTRDSRHILVHIDEVMAKTDKAFLAQVEGRELWIPFSAVDGYPPAVGESAAVPIAEWFAEREDLPEATDDGDTVTVFTCRPKRETCLRRVLHKVFGKGSELAILDGDKSKVRFDEDGKVRTLLTRFLTRLG